MDGSAESLPLPSGYADLVVCHIVLVNLPRVLPAVSEMARVARRGGVVAAVEPFGKSIYWNPNPEFDAVNREASQAFGRGVWGIRSELMGYPEEETERQLQYPGVFQSAGLTNVEAHGLLSLFLLSDKRRPTKETVAWLRNRLRLLEEDRERVALVQRRGGATSELTKRYHRLNRKYLEQLLANPDLIGSTNEVEANGRIVVVGFKS